MKADSNRQFWVVMATLVMITVNALANILPINGITTGAISDQFSVYFVPAGFVFSIWGVIYAAVIAFAVYQALPAQKEDPALRKIGWWYVVSCAANSAWILLWHYQQFVFTLAVMALLLTALIIIYNRLEIGIQQVTRRMRYLVHLPFSIYLGWITIATIANVTSVLDLLQWRGFGINEKMWAVIMLVVGVIIAELMAYNRRDLAFLAVLVWAFFGISQKFHGISPVYETATVAAVVVLVMMVITFLIKIKRSSSTMQHK